MKTFLQKNKIIIIVFLLFCLLLLFLFKNNLFSNAEELDILNPNDYFMLGASTNYLEVVVDEDSFALYRYENEFVLYCFFL